MNRYPTETLRTDSAVNPTRRKQVAGILGSLALTFVGLVLAALSNPKRFGLPAGWNHDTLAFCGFACVLVSGILFARTVREQMQVAPSNKIYTRLAVGHAFQLASGFLIAVTTLHFTIDCVLLVGLGMFVKGAMDYCENKGHSRSLGWLGITGIIGFTILFLLPDKHDVA